MTVLDYYSDDKKVVDDQLVPGDLVFFRPAGFTLWLSSFMSAIVSSNAVPISHVGMISGVKPSITMIHSTESHGVTEETYKQLNDLRESFWQNVEIRHVNVSSEIKNKAVGIAKQYLGEPYNNIFSPDFINSNGKHSFYCSQLVQHAYNEAAGTELFPSCPMNFTGTNGEILPYWVKHYEKLGLTEVPEGVNGTHPGGLFESDLLIGL